MRYHYEKPSIFLSMYRTIYECDHPVYSKCTLYFIDGKGLAIIQRLVDDLYLRDGFRKFFEDRSGECNDSLYPTVTIRQIMWALRIKPIKKGAMGNLLRSA